MKPPPDPRLKKLALVLGLLGSDQDGEVVAAARTAERIRLMIGMSWLNLLIPTTEVAAKPKPEQDDLFDWREEARQCLAQPDRLTEFELKFLRSLLGFSRISPKQSAVLNRVIERLAMEDA